jgi:hypothetical protein
MTRDDIIRMAREAGWEDLRESDSEMHEDFFMGKTQDLERFAALVAAAERNKVASWMMAQGYATGHGDTVEDLLKEVEWQVRESEREACAKLCEDKKTLLAWPTYAAAIRARGQA